MKRRWWKIYTNSLVFNGAIRIHLWFFFIFILFMISAYIKALFLNDSLFVDIPTC